MGRPPSAWLQRAYDIISDGHWHLREDVIQEMVKLVPPGVAYRRGIATSRVPELLSRKELVKRGARQLCHSSLNAAGYIKTDRRARGWLIQLGESDRSERPLLLERVDANDASHVLIPIEEYKALSHRPDEVDFVRHTHLGTVEGLSDAYQ